MYDILHTGEGMTSMNKHTIVQHSAFGYEKDYRFKFGLETRTLGNKKQIDRVEKAGGVVFDDYMDAEDYAFEQMYSEEVRGLCPLAKGTFSKMTVDGLHIYIPLK